MKLFRNYLCMAALIMGACMVTACDDDDDDDDASVSGDDTTTEEIANAVTGTYEGYTSVLFTYITDPYTYDNETVTITYVSADTVNVAYSNDTWGDYSVNAAVTANSDGSYTLAGSGTASMTAHGSTSDYDATVEATIADGAITTLTFTMAVMGTTTVTFIQGDAPAYAIGGNEYTTGTLAMEVSGIDCGSVADTLTVTATGVDAATLTLSGFAITIESMSMSMSFGDIAMEGFSVTTTDDATYTVSNDAISVESVVYNETSTIAVTGSATGTITSDGDVNITFTLTFGSMPMAVTCTYTVTAE